MGRRHASPSRRASSASSRLGFIRAAAFFAFGLCAFVATPLSATSEFVRGDVNEDGLVSIADLTRLIGFTILEGQSPLCHDSADVDDDGVINITDVISLISFLFGPNGSAGLPAPYPESGIDPTADALSPCNAPQGEPTGSELPHVFFFSAAEAAGAGFAVAPGQGPVYVPIRVTTTEPVEGMTISLGFESSQIDELVLDFNEGVPHEHDADLGISHISENFPGRVYGYILMELLPPFDESSFPPGEEMLIGHAVFEPSASLPVGSTIEIHFETLPPTGQEPPIRNEMAYDGAGSIYPITQSLQAPVVPLEWIFIRGDTNHDGQVDLSDGISLLQYLYLGIPDGIACLDACDVDDSGVLDLADALGLLFALFQPDPSVRPAPPFPYQGIDTTPTDPLHCDPPTS